MSDIRVLQCGPQDVRFKVGMSDIRPPIVRLSRGEADGWTSGGWLSPYYRRAVDLDRRLVDKEISGPGSGTRSGTRSGIRSGEIYGAIYGRIYGPHLRFSPLV